MAPGGRLPFYLWRAYGTLLPSLAPGAVEEVFRYDAPVQVGLRIAADDLELNGVDIPAGTPLWLLLGSANRDGRAPVKKSSTREGGRPSIYSPKMVRRLLKSVASGLNLKQSAIANGIHESTFQRWRVEHPEIVPQLEQAREKARQDALAVIWAARGEDWRAAADFLKYSFWQDYRPGAQVSVSTSLNQQVAVVATEEDRARLVALRESIMSGSTSDLQTRRAEVIEDQRQTSDAEIVETPPNPEQDQNSAEES